MQTWRYIKENAVPAHSGLAADEYLMSHYAHKPDPPPPTLRLYTYRSHCALVGRFQNIEAELDLEACRRLDVQFSRRPTGGGAILMGAQQLGLCFVAPVDFDARLIKPIDVYRRLAAPVIESLETFGIQAGFRPKNDLEVHGKKIAGLGVYYDSNGALLFHASLLVGLDVSLMLKVLKVPVEKIADKVNTKVVTDRITTISAELKREVCLDEVRNLVKHCYEKSFQVKFAPNSWHADEKAAVEKLAREKYLHEDWIYQRTPQPDMLGTSVVKTRAGLLRTYVCLKGEVIKSVLITGDFFDSSSALNQLEARLKWSAFNKREIENAVNKSMAEGGSSEFQILQTGLVEAIWQAGVNARAQSRLTNRGSCYYPLSTMTAEVYQEPDLF